MHITVQTLNSFSMKRPLFFLCGPAIPNKDSFIGRDGSFDKKAYLKAQKKDRRMIIRESIIEEKDRSLGFYPMPIIVDSIFKKGFIESNQLSLSLMEEIVASVSYKTYLFLDTMSTSYELGFFSNHAPRDDVSVFLAKGSDDRQRCPVGEYITKTIQKKFFYTPKYDGQGYFSFPGNKPPKSLASVLKADSEYVKKNQVTKIRFIQGKNSDLEFGEISYISSDEKLLISVSLKTFFYIFVYALNRSKDGWGKSYDEKNAIGAVKNALFQSFVGTVEDPRRIFMWSFRKPAFDVTIEGFGFQETAKHCYWLAKKILEIASSSRKPGSYEPTSAFDNSIFNWSYCLPKIDVFSAVFGSKSQSMRSLNESYGNDPRKFTKTKFLRLRGKNRKITTYSLNRNGMLLRQYHQGIASLLEWIYHPLNCVYSYIRCRGTLDCVSQHKSNTFFLKLDIHHFFESIRRIACVSEIYSSYFHDVSFDDFHYALQFSRFLGISRVEVNDLLAPCFYRGALPMGFVTSPIISNLFMAQFDFDISNDVDGHFVFTRYADDMLFSSDSKKALDYAKRVVLQRLNEKPYQRLKLNEEKECCAHFKHQGDSFKFLGILILFRGQGINEFRVAKSTLRAISVETAEAVKKKDIPGLERALARASYVQNISNFSYFELCHLYHIKTGSSFPKRVPHDGLWEFSF
jgi:hypothetical protein